jgi:hypothetical protein
MAILSVFHEGDFLRAVLLVQEKKLYRILFVQEYSLATFDASDLFYTIKKECGLNSSQIELVCPLETYDISIKHTELPFKDPLKIKKALSFFSLKNFCFPKKELIVCPLTKTAKNSASSTLFATSHQSLQNLTTHYSNLHLQPDSITCIPASLATFATHFCNCKKPLFIINVGFDQLNMVLVNSNIATHCFSHSIGLKDFIDTLIDNDYAPAKIDADLIKQLINSIINKAQHSHYLFNCTDTLKGSIERFIDSSSRGFKKNTSVELLFTGYGFIIEKHFCQNQCQMICQKTRHHIEYDSFTLKKYAIELGSALQLTKFSPNNPLFVPKDHSKSKKQQKIYSLLKTSALSLCSLLLLLLGLSSLFLGHKNKLLENSLAGCAQKFNVYDPSFIEKSTQHKITLLKNLQLKNIRQRTQIKKVQTLSPIINYIYQDLENTNIHAFSYKLMDNAQLVTFKLQKCDKKEVLEKITKHYKNNLLTLDEENGTIKYTLKY